MSKAKNNKRRISIPKKTNVKKTPKTNTARQTEALINRLVHLNKRKIKYQNLRIDLDKQHEIECRTLYSAPPDPETDSKIQTMKSCICDEQNIIALDLLIMWCESKIQDTLDRANDPEFISGLDTAPDPPDWLLKHSRHPSKRTWIKIQ